MRPPHYAPSRSRREFLMRSCGGLGALAVSSILQGAEPADPLAPKKPDHPPTAKSVIWLFMEGGPSHLDLFDPKPELERLAGKPMPPSYGKVITAMGTASNTLMPSARKWKQSGESGMWVSDYRAAGGRDHHDPLVLGGWAESRRFGVPDEYRLDPGRPAVDGRVGHVWARDGQQQPNERDGMCAHWR